MRRIHFSFIIAGFLTILVISCQQNQEAPPFPLAETGYRQPVTKKFRMPEPDTVQWLKTDSSEIKPLPVKKFNWNKLKTTTLDLEGAVDYKDSITTKSFSWDSLPSSPFEIEKLPQKKLNLKVVELESPTIVNAGSLINYTTASRSVMAVDFNFGLPGNPVSVFKDNSGMLWIGTTNGIARYDSEELELYGADQGLNVSYVYSIYEDSKGRIWIGSDQKITVLDLEKKLIYELSSEYSFSANYGIAEDQNGFMWLSNAQMGYDIIDFENQTIRRLSKSDEMTPIFITPAQDSNGLVWLTTTKGLKVIDEKRNRNIKIDPIPGYIGSFVVFVTEDSKGRIWIGSDAGTAMINKDRTKITKLNLPIEVGGVITAISENENNEYFLGTNNGRVYLYSEKDGTLKRINLSNTNDQVVHPIVIDRQGQMWASVIQGGLYRVNLHDGNPGNFNKDSGLTTGSVWSTLESANGKMWLGTYDGIDVYNPDNGEVKHLGVEQGLTGIRNSTLVQDAQGRIWSSGNQDGIAIIDPQKETISQLTEAQGLPSDTIRSIDLDKKGRVWMGSRDGLLIRVDLKNSDFQYAWLGKKTPSYITTVIHTDKKGKIWIGYNGGGILKIDPETNRLYPLTTQNGLVSDFVYDIDSDNENNIWIGTDKGVQLLNEQSGNITTFKTEQGLRANDVYAVESYKNKVYLGSSKGFSIFEQKNLNSDSSQVWTVKNIGKEQGLDFVDVAESSISFDKNGRLWAGVESQILTVMDQFREDSLPAKAYITGINILDKRRDFNNHRLLQAKRKGIDSLWSPSQNKYIQNASIQDSSYLAKHKIEWSSVAGPYDMPGDLQLPHSQNYLSFSYAGSNFRNPEEVVFRYFLKGIDKTWSPVSRENESENYRDLPPGDYTFMVRSKGANNIWSEPAELSFTIIPPWWKTWWAYILYAVVCIAILYGTIQYRSQWLKKENRVLEERVSERTAQLRKSIHDLENTQAQLIQSEKMASLGELTAGIAHEIQNPLNFVNNFSEVNSELIEELKIERLKSKEERDPELENELLTDIAENEKKIRHHGQRADAIVKGMLQHSRNSSTEKELTDVNKLADEYLRLSYHGLRAKDKTFNAGMKTDFDESIPKVFIAPQDIGRVMLNLINNAFYAVTEKKKTTSESGYEPMVIVSTHQTDKFVEIAIHDNGYGIPAEVKEKIFQPFFTTKPSGQGTGLGLSLSYDIIKAHGGILVLKTRHGVPVMENGTAREDIPEGTTFTIQLPTTLNGKTQKQKV